MASKNGLEMFIAEQIEGNSEPTADIVTRILPEVEKNDIWRRYLLRRGLTWEIGLVSGAARFSRQGKIRNEVRKRLEKSPLTNWRLESGKLLSLATRPDLIAAAESLEAMARGALAHAMLYRRLAARLKTDKAKLKTVVSNQEVIAEFSKCKEEVQSA